MADGWWGGEWTEWTEWTKWTEWTGARLGWTVYQRCRLGRFHGGSRRTRRRGQAPGPAQPARGSAHRTPRAPAIERRSGDRNSSEVDISLSCWQMGITACLLLALPAGPIQAETWMGLEVEPESRCSAYERKRDYPYSQSLEYAIAKRMGGIRCRYTGTVYGSLRQTHIEHVVALSEAHDSGLCAADAATKRRFANDLLNLTLSDPLVNSRKGAKDAGEWMPRIDPRRFAETVIQVKLKYGLSIDRRERAALEKALDGHKVAPPDSVGALVELPVVGHPLDLWDDNGNGRITCAEAERHGIAPVRRGHPAYVYMRDGDGDGWVCE